MAWTCWWSLCPLFGSVLWIWMLFMISQLSLYPLESVFPFWPIRHCCKGAFQMKLSLALRTGCDRVFFWRGGEALKFSFTNKWHCTIWRCSWQIGPQKGIFFFFFIYICTGIILRRRDFRDTNTVQLCLEFGRLKRYLSLANFYFYIHPPAPRVFAHKCSEGEADKKEEIKAAWQKQGGDKSGPGRGGDRDREEERQKDESIHRALVCGLAANLDCAIAAAFW